VPVTSVAAAAAVAETTGAVATELVAAATAGAVTGERITCFLMTSDGTPIRELGIDAMNDAAAAEAISMRASSVAADREASPDFATTPLLLPSLLLLLLLLLLWPFVTEAHGGEKVGE
jgi:hypothetical protein